MSDNEPVPMTDEQLLLKANEMMLASKGFILITVKQDGDLETAWYLKSLTNIEKLGLIQFMRTFTIG